MYMYKRIYNVYVYVHYGVHVRICILILIRYDTDKKIVGNVSPLTNEDILGRTYNVRELLNIFKKKFQTESRSHVN